MAEPLGDFTNEGSVFFEGLELRIEGLRVVVVVNDAVSGSIGYPVSMDPLGILRANGFRYLSVCLDFM